MFLARSLLGDQSTIRLAFELAARRRSKKPQLLMGDQREIEQYH